MVNFQGFSPDSFEQFIRALALDILGPGVTIFGNGPDGGREACFKGKVNFPFPPNDLWDGYGVIQAKFKEKPEGTKKDQAWAEAQLNSELAVWQRSATRVPKPEYFIFCTNVELSSASNGGRAALEKVFKSHKSALGLRGYAIWDANQLAGYIDTRTEIRQRFSCFFTSGDLLAAFANLLTKTPSPETVLASYLAREILVDEDARLSQAGDRSEDRIRLASVFIDLPSAGTAMTDPPESDDDLAAASLHELLRAASSKLDPIALYEESEPGKSEDTQRQCLYGRFVFLGGPGSGKSTLGQFLAQIHRAALLDRRPHHRLESKVKTVIKDIKARCSEEKAAWPSTPRYPFRVELNAFAKALASGQGEGVVSLSEYLRRNLSGDFAVTHEDLRDWMRQFPLLLILDGLDEVPSSSNRREVIGAIQNFLNEARDVEADLMIVASSRPDGYAGEFDGDEVSQRYLLPLSKVRALACAARYVSAKTSSNNDQRAESAMAILGEAIENPLVARLMRSPLQVTFMVTVVAASGKPSESRWQLFNDYYRIIYERELHKAVRPFDQVLNERRQDIDALHHEVGFILQCRAEQSGGTQGDLSIGEFERIVSACLEENGQAADGMEQQTQMILGAAKLRLVFLTSRTPGKLSFDVRSLQEYMAAACITNGDSAEIIRRLEAIAHSAFWRNTFLFAVGRFFVEPRLRNHRDKIRVLCDDLNRHDPRRSAVKLGSHLALDILESGTVGNVPLVIRNLADCALELLSCTSATRDQIAWRLANIYQPLMESEYKAATSLIIGQKNLYLALPAWLVVFFLERKQITWAEELVTNMWPKVETDAATILNVWISCLKGANRVASDITQLDVQRIGTLLPRISLRECERIVRTIDSPLLRSGGGWISICHSWLNDGHVTDVKVLCGKDEAGLDMRVNSLSKDRYAKTIEALRLVELNDDCHPDWHILCRLIPLYADLTPDRFSSAIEILASSCETDEWSEWTVGSPWPVKCCVDDASSKSDLFALAEKIRSYRFGDKATLMAMENGWRESGISVSDLCTPFFEDGPAWIQAASGLSVSASLASSCNKSLAASLLNHLLEAQRPKLKGRLAWMLAFYGSHTAAIGCLDPLVLQNKMLPAQQHWWDSDILVEVSELEGDQKDWLNFFDHYGRLRTLSCSQFFWGDRSRYPLEFVLKGFSEDISQLGLLRLAGFWCANGQKPTVNVLSVISLDQIADVRIRLAAILVRIAFSPLTSLEIAQLAPYISTVLVDQGEPDAATTLLSTIERHAKETPAIELLIAEVENAIPRDQWQLRARAESLRFAFLEAHSSGFDQQALLSHGLPSVAAI